MTSVHRLLFKIRRITTAPHGLALAPQITSTYGTHCHRGCDCVGNPQAGVEGSARGGAAGFPALLLRIDSPGGTVGDSQEIHAALLRLREKGCHVVASFGNISASGGVYIGVAAEKIVSNPGCITGSIGVILRGNNLSKLLERVGIRFETVKSGAYKDILSPDRALSADERNCCRP